MYVRLYVRKYDEDYKKKMKISFIVFLLILTLASLLYGTLGLLSIPIFLVLFFFLFRTIIPRNFKVREYFSMKYPRTEPKPKIKNSKINEK